MVAGFLVISIVAGLGSAAMALILGQAVWIVALAYLLGGMLGVGLGLVWGCLWAWVGQWRDLTLARRQGQHHGP
jgi:Na+/melibiose symporter-like transporter